MNLPPPVNDTLLCCGGSLCLNGVSRVAKIYKELSRGETARGVEQAGILNPWVSVYLLLKNKHPDRMTPKRVIKLCYLIGILPAFIVDVLYEPVAFVSGLCQRQLPVGIYSEEGFKEIYGDEYILVDSNIVTG